MFCLLGCSAEPSSEGSPGLVIAGVSRLCSWLGLLPFPAFTCPPGWSLGVVFFQIENKNLTLPQLKTYRNFKSQKCKS